MPALDTPDTDQLRATFIQAATWHGTLDEAEALLSAHPELAHQDIHTAAILGDHDSVRKFLAEDPLNVTATSAPFGANALTHLALSKYLRLAKRPSDNFIQAATALLDAGADPNGGFWTRGKSPEYETPLYGAAGVAHHAGLTRLLLDRGADPNDEEAVYHSPEEYDSSAMQLLVETGQVTRENLALMLIRKHDWHDMAGIEYLLQRGINPNDPWPPDRYPLHHALARDNGLPIITLLMDHGADPMIVQEGLTAVARAARGGRNEVLELFEQRGLSIDLPGVDRLIAAAAMGNTPAAQKIAAQDPNTHQELLTMGGGLLARFTRTNNLKGVRTLLELGIDVNTPFTEGDGYYCIPPGSLAIHIAAWMLHTEMVRFLLEKGAPAGRPDANGDTPLQLAVRASTDSYWTRRFSPEIITALRDAGASSYTF